MDYGSEMEMSQMEQMELKWMNDTRPNSLNIMSSASFARPSKNFEPHLTFKDGQKVGAPTSYYKITMVKPDQKVRANF